MKKQFYTIAALLALGLTAKAQIGIGITTPDPSAILDLTSTTKGLLLPRMTSAQRTAIAAPVAGLHVYDTTTNTEWYYNGTGWINENQDLRLVGSNNHLTADAGIGSNGTNAGSGVQNIGIGANTLVSNTTSSYLIAIGSSALSSNTLGSGNIGIGLQALRGNTIGNQNTAIGWTALGNNTLGSGNIAIGYNASGSNTGGSSNTAIGYNTLAVNNSGSNNTAYGIGSLGNATGNNNTAIGAVSGSALTSGSNNIVIGQNAQLQSNTANDQLNIGNNIWGTGLSGTNTGNIGIGTSAPTSKLTVNGASTNLSSYNAGSSATIDFSLSNLAYTTASAGNITLNNLKDGGTYTLAVKNTTSGTYTFTTPGFTAHQPSDNGATTSGKHTIYTFLVIGTDVYTAWNTGL